MNQKPTFTAGKNIAMKVPAHLYEQTIGFYRDVIGLEELTSHAPAKGFKFGANHLWIDSVATLSQAETWFEILTHDIEAASAQLAAAGVVRCDAIEPLAADFQAFWISSPASIIHLVCKDTETWS
ncbi:hypothetical protein [Paucibacter sp. XJ19-41]|uniref:hypothetical protein n=1 Tax=Paucibacter sp. XJ19-41 TaxID=2927824 RepID=UPI00234BE51B|nr:hypothetical protein [Paucibacter sp. XJ19-41]MDC6171063.1 hypothetical protein [Paucibacter sp. XJ19-41]